MSKSPKRAFGARSFQSHPSFLQNEHCVRNFLKNSHLKSAKQAFRTRLPPKVTRDVCKTSVSPTERTHQVALPGSFAILAPPNNTRSHANPNVTATFTSTTTRNFTIPCACHKIYVSTRLISTKHCAFHEIGPPPHLATSRFPALAISNAEKVNKRRGTHIAKATT